MERASYNRKVEEFLNYLDVNLNYSKATIKNYLFDLNRFYDFLKLNEVGDFLDIDLDVVRKFFLSLTNENLSSRTRARFYSSLNSFFKFLLEERVLNLNPLELIKSPKYTKKVPDYLYDSQIEEIFKCVTSDNLFLEKRNKLIIGLFLESGIRLNELTNIKLEDLYLDERTIKIFGKGSKDRFVFFTDDLKEKMEEYLNLRNELALDDFLFINYKGKKISNRSIELMLEDLGNKIGIKLHPHMLRHTFASNLLTNGCDLLVIKELLGHESLDTTQVYMHIDDEFVKAKYELAHPHSDKNNK